MTIMKKKSLIYLCFTLVASTCVYAQEMTLSKEQFLQMTDQMLSRSEELKAQMQSNTDAQMKQHLSEEQYQQYKADEKMMREEENAQLADCLGISESKLESIKAKVTPQVIGTAVKDCSSKLPNTITMSTLDWSSNPELTDFNACTEEKIADKANVSLAKFQQCSSQEEDW